MEFQSRLTIKFKILFIFTFQNLENFGMLQTTTLKRNLVLEIRERLERKLGSEYIRALPPLKETFVGSLWHGFILGSSWLWLGIGSSFVSFMSCTSFPIGGCLFTHSEFSKLLQTAWADHIFSLWLVIHISWLLNYFWHWRVTLWVNQKTEMSRLHDTLHHTSCWRLRQSSTILQSVTGGQPHSYPTFGSTCQF